MAPPNHQFISKSSDVVRRRLSSAVSGRRPSVPGYAHLQPMWAGIAGAVINSSTAFEVAISVHDSVYNTDFASTVVPYDANDPDAQSTAIEQHVMETLRKFSTEHMCKFLGAGVTLSLLKEAPNLCTHLWLDMDIVPIVFNIKPFHTDSLTRPNIKHRISSTTGSYVPSGAETPTVYYDPSQLQDHNKLTTNVNQRLPIPRTVDEQADSAARKCIMYFGPGNNPRLSIASRNQVAVDSGGKIHLVDDIDEYKTTTNSKGTWNSVIKLADELRDKKIKMGFFSSTPQGGGVALMRHALIRFLTLLDVDAAWYVPNPSPSVFRTTKNNHNILQGVADPNLRLTKEAKDNFDAWIFKNGLRWTAEGGPLAPGGVDIAFVDDPQMPGLIPLIKRVRPDLPIIYRSHIEIRSDLVHNKGSPQEEVWKYLWNNIQHADMFISHPVNKFVPSDVPLEKLALLGAATDWLDGLNKHLDPWDSQYYMGEFRSLCAKEKMHELAWPAREYIVQIARFDPSKGIPNVLDSYARFRRMCAEGENPIMHEEIPQLLVCGHGAVDDPDASIIYDQIMSLVSTTYKEYFKDIIVMRCPPSDQLLNVLMANSRFALQLSTREGFEVKVSEALHAGKPVIASRTGGIPLQIEHEKSGFLCTPGDNDAVAKHMYALATDEELYQEMSEYARTHVSDEVSTVGNAAAWMYLAVMYCSRGVNLHPKGAWINDLMRTEMGEPYIPGEPRLPRGDIHVQG
ncbi:Trehalose phosphorylase [Sparassis crispa]|uniref:Trehalose phosphorylase n=1 Tax=Sparassis crispa TaxID=139825 RepID=A0A401GKE7_9APHY|nr:Trehalose phosphorylase [Sparassis crispa]GBE82614.1 Trehalose phosphorylase [Sparassis crispa]